MFEPSRHEKLIDRRWDPAAARAAIEAIAAEAARAYRVNGLWPPHPRDETDAPMKTVYSGAAGVAVALAMLDRREVFRCQLDLGAVAKRICTVFDEAPDAGAAPGLLLGAAGVWLMRHALAPQRANADRLAEAIEANLENPARELMWGAPGTLVAAQQMWVWTREPRFADLARASIDALWKSWRRDGDAGCWSWTQQIHGGERRYLGACHGAAGVLGAMLAAREHLPAERQRLLVRRSAEWLEATAVREKGMANWPASLGESPLLLQWCHGAPGVITSLSAAPFGTVIDRLLADAGDLVWRAGPLAKGVSLCHGTAGNGFALLTLHQRGGNELWLERARRFAMHAIEQRKRIRSVDPQPRHGLWTGEMGLALFLADCLEPKGVMPFAAGLPLLPPFRVQG